MVQAPTETSPTYFSQLEALLAAAKTKAKLYQTIVDAPFHNKQAVTDIGLGIVVLLLVNKARQTIDRVALSHTYHAAGAVKASEKPFRSIRIPLQHQKNLIAQAITTGQPMATDDWQYLFVPALTKDQARYNQAGADIQHSEVWPIPIPSGGALIFSFYRTIDEQQARQFMEQYRSLAAKYLREHS